MMPPLEQPPHNTSLLGVLEGASRHFGHRHSTPWLYGASGHAFLINVHREICPSGPYMWHWHSFDKLLANLGLRMRIVAFCTADTPADERAAAERAVQDAFADGQVCSLINMDHQLITGHDEAGFDLAQPWGPLDITPPRLGFGAWGELGDEVHVTFYAIEPAEPAEPRTAIRNSLAYAIDLYRRPAHYAFADYGIGPDAYANWRAALPQHGKTHGNWWNGSVWGECRAMAGRYLAEVAERFPDMAPEAQPLAERYEAIGAALLEVADKERPDADKAAALDRAAELEAGALAGLERLAAGSADRTPTG